MIPPHAGPEYTFNEKAEQVMLFPAIEVSSSGEGDVVLSWFNTKVRRFLDPQYDHIEYTGIDGNVSGIVADESRLAELEAKHYPSEFMPMPDQQTGEWMISRLMADVVVLPTDTDH